MKHFLYNFIAWIFILIMITIVLGTPFIIAILIKNGYYILGFIMLIIYWAFFGAILDEF